MQYFSLDIETTGLDPLKDQILEIALVVEDTNLAVNIDKLPYFHCYVDHEEVHGNALALSMNADILRTISKGEGNCLTPWAAVESMNEFVKEHSHEKKIVIAGKNVAGFDIPFLENMGYDLFKYHHRTIDPAMLYTNFMMDNVPPSLQECLIRAGHDVTVAHRAVDDARDVIRLVRAAQRNK